MVWSWSSRRCSSPWSSSSSQPVQHPSQPRMPSISSTLSVWIWSTVGCCCPSHCALWSWPSAVRRSESVVCFSRVSQSAQSVCSLRSGYGMLQVVNTSHGLSVIAAFPVLAVNGKVAPLAGRQQTRPGCDPVPGSVHSLARYARSQVGNRHRTVVASAGTRLQPNRALQAVHAGLVVG